MTANGPISAERLIDDLYQGRADLAKACLLDSNNPPDFDQIAGEYNRCVDPNDNVPDHASVGYFFFSLNPQTPALRDALNQAIRQENTSPSILPNQHPLRLQAQQQEEIRRGEVGMMRINLFSAPTVATMRSEIEEHPRGGEILTNIDRLFGADAPFGLSLYVEKIRKNDMNELEITRLNRFQPGNIMEDLQPTQDAVSPGLHALWVEEMRIRREVRDRR